MCPPAGRQSEFAGNGRKTVALPAGRPSGPPLRQYRHAALSFLHPKPYTSRCDTAGGRGCALRRVRPPGRTAGRQYKFSGNGRKTVAFPAGRPSGPPPPQGMNLSCMRMPAGRQGATAPVPSQSAFGNIRHKQGNAVALHRQASGSESTQQRKRRLSHITWGSLLKAHMISPPRRAAERSDGRA